MQHYRLMRIEDISRPVISGAEQPSGLHLLSILNVIGFQHGVGEKGFERRMLNLAGYDIGRGISLDPIERAQYVDAVNRLVWVWNGFEQQPIKDEFEAALRDFLAIGADVQ
jgi:hypothetical protein